MNVLQLVGAGLGVWALHLLSRRAFVVSSFAVMVVGLLVIGLFPDAPGVLVVAAFGLFTLVISGASNIQFVYPSEMFETRLRTTVSGSRPPSAGSARRSRPTCCRSRSTPSAPTARCSWPPSSRSSVSSPPSRGRPRPAVPPSPDPEDP